MPETIPAERTWTLVDESAFFVDKSAWGEGKWQSEPDKVQFNDPKTGYPCLIVRSRMGSLCGYAGIPPEHPLFGVYCEDLPPEISIATEIDYSGLCQEGAEEWGVCHIPEPGETDRIWWLGFSCSHLFDVIPAMSRLDSVWDKLKATYKDVAYVKEQIGLLALQLHGLS